ncbi:MAG: LON peptidase substrate-binding domain-containing protein [Candidatus Hinthialibacter sp.]
MRNYFSLKNFSGRLPIFPLPKVVHFPHTMLPLHIFEKRYQKMLNDALEGEGLIGMAVLKPGWEQNYSGNPDIYPMACLGTILKHEPLQDGRSNILLLGLKRVRIKEIIKPLPYRMASVEILEDMTDNMTREERIKMKKELLEIYSEVVIEHADSKQHFPALSNAGFNLAELTDALSASLGLPIPVQIRLLDESDVLNRSVILKEKMEALLKRSGPRIIGASTDPNLPDIHLN